MELQGSNLETKTKTNTLKKKIVFSEARLYLGCFVASQKLPAWAAVRKLVDVDGSCVDSRRNLCFEVFLVWDCSFPTHIVEKGWWNFFITLKD